MDLFAGGVGGIGGDAVCAALLAGGAGGDALYATLYTGGCGGVDLFAEGVRSASGDALSAMRCLLRGTLEAMEGGLYLLEVLEVLGVL